MRVTMLVSCALVGAAVLGACSEKESQVAQPRREQREIMAALCEARDVVGRADGASEAIFLDRAHDRLHDLATDTAQVDRSVAARLLEAKQAVEAELEAPSSSRLLAADLDALINSTRRALEVTSGDGPRCAKETGDG